MMAFLRNVRIFASFSHLEADQRDVALPCTNTLPADSFLHSARQQQTRLLRATDRASPEQVLHPLLCQ